MTERDETVTDGGLPPTPLDLQFQWILAQFQGSISELSRATGIDDGTLSRWKNGNFPLKKWTPPLEKLDAFARDRFPDEYPMAAGAPSIRDAHGALSRRPAGTHDALASELTFTQSANLNAAPVPAQCSSGPDSNSSRRVPGGGVLLVVGGLIVGALVTGIGVWWFGGPPNGSVDNPSSAAGADSSGDQDQVLEPGWSLQTTIPSNSVNTLTDPSGSQGVGPDIRPSETVAVSCRIYSDAIPSALPDGWFYRIESSPWDGGYYASANSFLNGDPADDPARWTHATDFAVPECGP